ncbi:unnamed protein product, partial [Allacma fusca]
RYAIYKALESLSEAKESCFAKCSGTENCIGITWKIDPALIDDPECTLVTYQTLSEQLQTLNANKDFYSLQSPLLRSQEFSIYPNFEIVPSFEQPHIQVINGLSNPDDCIAKCNEKACKQLSYNKKTKICTITNGGAFFVENPDSLLLVRVPKLNSTSAGFTQLVGTGIKGEPLEVTKIDSDVQYVRENIEKCLEFCLNYIEKDDRSCDFVTVQIKAKSRTEAEIECRFLSQDAGNVEKISGSQTFARVVASLSITQESLDKVDMFQSRDFYNCFREPPANSFQYLQGFAEDLEPPTNSSQDNTASSEIQIRRRRGLFSAIGNFFKKVGKAVVETVKDIGKSVVKGAETIANVVKGDFKKAKETFLEIPIVRDVKDTVESGIELVKAVGSGDWKKAGSKALDFAGNAVGLIPIPAGKIPGKIAKNILKSPKKAAPKPKEKINKPKKDKEAESNKDKQACKPKNRGKRAAAKNDKKRPCDDDDDDDKKCSKAIVSNIFEADSSCQKQRKFEANKPCTLVCDAGYEENKRNPVCKKQPSGKFDWTPPPKCEPQSCGKLTGGIATFPVRANHPQVASKKVAVYYIKYDSNKKLPVYSATFHDELNYLPNRAKRDSNPFKPHPCTPLVNKQLSNPNYVNTGYDKGHVTPDQAISALGALPRESTYLFVNIAPQDRHTNQQPWKRMESHVYCFTKKHSGMVITGLCPGASSGTLPVSPCFWKLVCYKEPKSKDTRVVGIYGDNSKVVGTAAKKLRNTDVFTLRSQREIKAKAGLSDSATVAMWTQSYAELVKSRNPGSIPLPTSCASALDLPNGLKGTWVDEAKQIGKETNKDKNKKKTKRSVDGETFGCSKNELKEYQAFISSILGDDEDSDNGNSGDGSDNEGDGGGDAGNTQTFSSSSCGKRLIGYYPSWGKYSFTNVQGKSLTHAVFAFFETFADGSIKLGSADANNSPDYGKDVDVAKKRLGNFLRIKKTFSHLKTLFAVGGWENSQYFSAIAANPSKRLQFISSTLEIIDQYGFDGIDIDWEHPVTGGAVEGIPADKQNYVQLMKELREALDQHKGKSGRSEKFLISFAGAAGQWTLDPGLDLPGLLKYADFANVMTYDYFGAWASKWGAYTGPPSPLFFGNPKGFSGKVNADWTIKYYVCKSKKPHQINMGVPFYGRFWENVGDPIDPKDGMWRKAESVGGVFKGGFVPWRDVKSEYLNNPEFKKEFHEKAKVPYAFNAGKKIFLGYENPESLSYKVKYAEDYNVGGLMIWALDQDDEDYSMMTTLMKANLCKITDANKIVHRCPPIDEKRWWTPEDGYDKAGMCGKSAPLYKGYYPVCDPDDPGYSCCGAHGYCGSGPDFCGCPTCIDYRENPEKIIQEPVKPTMPINWYILTDEDGKRGRCGRGIPLLNGKVPICNPDDPNTHCCSNGGYCGAGQNFCECDGCVDFKKTPNHVFKEKTWWDWADGEDKFGRCGSKAPKMNGKDPECNPDSRSHCCSSSGWCGSGSEFCDCDGCKNYKK